MVKRSSRQVIFFVLVFLMFFLAVKIGQLWLARLSNLNHDIIFIIIGLAYTCSIIGFYYLAKINTSSEGFWEVSPAARCKGNWYMHQGDSESAKMCQEMAETPEGRAEISSYNCPTGYIGVPKVPFVYTPLSDDNWQDERIMEEPKPTLKDVPSMKSLTAQIQN